MPEEPRVHLVFAGPTLLARAFCALEKDGYACEITSAPGGNSPCGLALAIRAADHARVLQLLQALGIRPYGPVRSETAGAAPRR